MDILSRQTQEWLQHEDVRAALELVLSRASTLERVTVGKDTLEIRAAFPHAEAPPALDEELKMADALADESARRGESLATRDEVLRRALTALQGSRLIVWPWLKGGTITFERWEQACREIDESITELLAIVVAEKESK